MTKQTDFINKVSDGAIQSYLEVGVLPSVTIAQAILESGWGTSTLATKANNLFGIKGTYNGESYTANTKEYVNGAYQVVKANFRKYPTFEDSIEDHSKLLTADRYSGARWKTDYKEVTAALSSAGYATDPNYASTLNELIEEYNLTSYDTKSINESSTSKETDSSTDTDATNTAEVKPVDTSTDTDATDSSTNDTTTTGVPSDSTSTNDTSTDTAVDAPTDKSTSPAEKPADTSTTTTPAESTDTPDNVIIDSSKVSNSFDDSYALFKSTTKGYLVKTLEEDAILYLKDDYVKITGSYQVVQGGKTINVLETSDNVYVQDDSNSLLKVTDKGVNLLDSYTS